MLTGSGKALLVAAAVLLTLGLLWRYPELVAIGLACVVALLVAVAWIIVRPDVVAVRTIMPTRVTQGEPSVASMTITNRGSRRSPPLFAEERVGEGFVGVSIPSLAPHGAHSQQYDLDTTRRGRFPIGPLTIGQADPLELMSFGRSFASRSTLWVYPKVHHLDAVLSSRAAELEGATSSTSPQGGVAFHAIRPFVWGDDHRFIDWKATARTDVLHVRQMVVPDRSRVLLVLDTDEAAYPDAECFEDAVRAAASLAVAAAKQLVPLEFRTTGEVVLPADERNTDGQLVMDVLAAVEVEPQSPGLVSLARMLPEHADVTLIVVTGQPSSTALSAVGAVRTHFQMATLAQVGERFGRPSSAPAGVVGINARGSEQFAQLWNRQLRA